MKKLRVLFWNNDARGFFGGPGTYVNVTQFTGTDYVRIVEFALLTGPSGSFSGPGLKFFLSSIIPIIYMCVCFLLFFLPCPSLSWGETRVPGQLQFNFTRG